MDAGRLAADRTRDNHVSGMKLCESNESHSAIEPDRSERESRKGVMDRNIPRPYTRARIKCFLRAMANLRMRMYGDLRMPNSLNS